MAMLKHEETFREQVYELHRLYQIQKMLMQNIPRSKTKGQNQETYLNYQNDDLHQKPHTNNNVDIEQPAKEYVIESDDGGVEIEDENEIELTLAPSSFYRRRSKTETPLNSDSAFSISSSSSGSSHIKRGERKRENVTTHTWGLVEVPAVSNLSFLSGRKNSSDHIEEQMRQDRVKQQQPPWLYQVLSLNMT